MSLIIIGIGAFTWFNKGLDFKKGKKVMLIGTILLIFTVVSLGIIMLIVLQILSSSMIGGFMPQ
jgi:hypothetical protein